MNVKIWILSLAIAFTAFACSNNTDAPAADEVSSENTENGENDGAEEEVEVNKLAKLNEVGGYGDPITAEGAMGPGEMKALFSGGAEEVGGVKVQGNISACCMKKGCWMDMTLADGETMKVRFKDYGFFMPFDIVGKDVIVEGKAMREEVSVSDLQHYAEDAGKSEEEIAAITEPSMEYTFEAVGVLPVTN